MTTTKEFQREETSEGTIIHIIRKLDFSFAFYESLKNSRGYYLINSKDWKVRIINSSILYLRKRAMHVDACFKFKRNDITMRLERYNQQISC